MPLSSGNGAAWAQFLPDSWRLCVRPTRTRTSPPHARAAESGMSRTPSSNGPAFFRFFHTGGGNGKNTAVPLRFFLQRSAETARFGTASPCAYYTAVRAFLKAFVGFFCSPLREVIDHHQANTMGLVAAFFNWSAGCQRCLSFRLPRLLYGSGCSCWRGSL